MFEKFLLNIALPRKNYFIIFWLSLILLTFLLFISLSYLIYTQNASSLDLEITRRMQNFPSLTTLMLFVSAFGETTVIFFMFILVMGFLFLKGYKKEATFMPVVLIAPILNTMVKELAARPRPSGFLVDVFEPLPQYSFPSGHVTYYVVFFGFLAFLGVSLPKLEPKWRVLLVGISIPLIFLVGPSRVYLGAHWPSDVLGAYLFGGLYLFVLVLVYLKYVYRLPNVRNEQNKTNDQGKNRY